MTSLPDTFIQRSLWLDAWGSGSTLGHSQTVRHDPDIMVLAAPEKNHGGVHVPMMDAAGCRDD